MATTKLDTYIQQTRDYFKEHPNKELSLDVIPDLWDEVLSLYPILPESRQQFVARVCRKCSVSLLDFFTLVNIAKDWTRI